ncbi:MAG: T9SS type A sorting domain-containing protein [Candidatus Cloacimonadota bacterium]|nr:MAG: T9SS type A sorting domain-containing protein [Candidatus Cloacimonadota bacterium]
MGNYSSDNVTVLEEVKTYDSPLASSITPFPGNIITTSLPVFTGNSINSRSPANCKIMKVLYKLNTTQEPWNEALITAGGGTEWVSWEAQATEPLTTGFHTLYVVALDMTSATINMTENFTGSITPYYFFVASSYIDIVEYSISDSYTPDDPWRVDGTVSLSFTVRNVSEQVIENIGFSSSDLVNDSNYIYGNMVTFSPSIILELQPGYVDTVTATVPVVIGQAAGTYTGTFCASPGRSSPDYVNVSLFVDTLWDIDVQDYGASLAANRMTLVGVENSVVLGKFNLDNPNTKDDNFDPYDGPGNIKIENIAYMPGSLFAYGNVDTIPKSNISMVASVTSLETGGAYQCILQVAIPAGKPTGRDFVGDFTVESGSINDEFRLKVIVVEPGGSVTSLYAFWGDAAYDGNHLYWTDFSMNEKGYNLYRSDASDTTFARLNSMAIAEIEYLDMYVRLGTTYQYKLGIKLEDNKELLIGPISLTAIGGPDLPSKFSLRGCYPNPFSKTTMISFQCPVTGDKTEISLRIYDLSGRIVKTLVDEECRPGYYTAKWDGRDRTGKKVSSGIYFYRLNAGDFESVKKLILLK